MREQPLLDAVEYFIARWEGNHPDGPIRSVRTLAKFKEALTQYKSHAKEAQCDLSKSTTTATGVPQSE